jgi:hypothetical protein
MSSAGFVQRHPDDLTAGYPLELIHDLAFKRAENVV